MYTSKLVAIFILITWLLFKLSRIGKRAANLPPGPPTVPLLGNIHLLPTRFSFVKFTEWAKEYGGIMSLKVASGTIIVLSDMQSVKDILDDRSSETAFRPSLHAADVVTEKKYIPLANPDNHVWRMGRRAIQPLVSHQAVQEYLPVAELETTQLLHDIIHNPDGLCHHISRYTFSFIASVVFGKAAPTSDSPELAHFNNYMRHQSSTVSPEAAPVDLIPILKYVPERWAPWKQLWTETRRLQRSLYYSFLEQSERRIESGAKSGAFIERIMDRQEELKLTREMVA
ncbi:Cytochrome P450 monooxygenase [Psilocybe cubensis]|uniref:Cytochrome P450 monooxygenase n=2 Tax=Psilocybe cubensis TaxID=181762 RepID=A0ACB8GKY2_PSICU|nr:Cytochrome P450 monooxygenase [Psilocybe cubensis]KAH9476395.1 Cytochrome P450 monooxygenase [Psilocybe cubensis]